MKNSLRVLAMAAVAAVLACASPPALSTPKPPAVAVSAMFGSPPSFNVKATLSTDRAAPLYLSTTSEIFRAEYGRLTVADGAYRIEAAGRIQDTRFGEQRAGTASVTLKQASGKWRVSYRLGSVEERDIGQSGGTVRIQ